MGGQAQTGSDALAGIALANAGPTRLEATDARHHPCPFVLSAAGGLAPGAELRLLVSPFRAVLDSQCWDQIRLLDVRPSPAFAVELRRRPPANVDEIFEGYEDGRTIVLHLTLPEGCPPGAALEVELGVKPSPHARIDVQVDAEARSGPEETFRPVGGRETIAVVAGPPVGLECRARAVAGSLQVSVFARDAHLNVADSYEGRVELTGPAPGLPRAVELRDGRAVVELEDAGRADGAPLRLEARDPERGWSAVSNPVCARRPYFGELHFHTVFSGDGGGELPDAYAYARDVLQLDLCAVTDHSPVEHWQATKEIDDAFDDPGRFATLHSWEWSTRHGHANVYLRPPDPPAGPEREVEAEHPSHLEWPEGTIVIPHHTNIDSSYDDPDYDGPVHWFPYDWSRRNPAIRLVEVAQCRGNFEADEIDPAWGIVTEGLGSSVQDALAMGYRIGFVGGTDNHSSAPSRDSLKPGEYVGLTGVYAEELSRAAIWDALWNRRTFATSGVPIVGWTRIAGAEMGGEVAGHAGDATFEAELHGTAAIARVEVIGDREVVWAADPNEPDVTIRGVVLPPCGWYYVRLRQVDGHRAWFSPVWVDRA
ncbi:MAG TPA: CehA/McbA family metallohydrolase [Gaiellaceae bacterium]|nr:CehA/McbA family metallohydrolase [Gaiellaceae bacterium]